MVIAFGTEGVVAGKSVAKVAAPSLVGQLPVGIMTIVMET